MGKLLLEDNGNLRSSEDVEFAEKIIDLYHENDVWGVIDELVTIWAKRAPDEVQAQKIQVKDYREQLADPIYGQTLGGKHFERRFTMSLPTDLTLMIRTIYKAEELPFDDKFYGEFGTRYPFFKVSERN